MNLSILKRGQVGVDEVLKWILYLAIGGAAGFAIWRVFHIFGN